VDVDRDLRFRGGFPSEEEEDSPSDEECEEEGRSCSLGVREGDLPLRREEREVERADLLEERECLEDERACRFEECEDSCRCSDWVLWCEEEDEWKEPPLGAGPQRARRRLCVLYGHDAHVFWPFSACFR
jgi:hypothetical protein